MSQKPLKQSGLTLDTTPESFFFELVREAIDHQKVKVQPETEFYVVKLLNRFIFSESLYTKNTDGGMDDQPLAFLYKEAIEAEVMTAQKSLFQNVGDISLFKAGFFQESLSRSLVDLDYYIGLGGSAYRNAAQRSEDKHFRNLFGELADQFGTVVDVLSEVSEQTTVTKTEQDLLRLYEMWSRTGSERAARALTRTGIKLQKEPKKHDS